MREAPIRGLQRSLYGQLEDGFAREHSPPSSRGWSESDFEFVEHDITTHVSIGGELDEVYHFASPASPKDFSRIPIDILKVGALGTLNCLGLARAKGARLMLASTSEVYGDPLVHPQPEAYWGNVNPIGIWGVYDEAKRYAEALTMAYSRHHKVDTRIVRIFNTYGPRMREDDGRMVPNFIGQTLLGLSNRRGTAAVWRTQPSTKGQRDRLGIIPVERDALLTSSTST